MGLGSKVSMCFGSEVSRCSGVDGLMSRSDKVANVLTLRVSSRSLRSHTSTPANRRATPEGLRPSAATPPHPLCGDMGFFIFVTQDF